MSKMEKHWAVEPSADWLIRQGAGWRDAFPFSSHALRPDRWHMQAVDRGLVRRLNNLNSSYAYTEYLGRYLDGVCYLPT